MISFAELWNRYDWRPIRNCPGRYVLKGSTKLIPEDFSDIEREAREFIVTTVQDPVLVTRLEGGGLISYCKKDGNNVHTLNTEEGFARKLEQLGIQIGVHSHDGI